MLKKIKNHQFIQNGKGMVETFKCHIWISYYFAFKCYYWKKKSRRDIQLRESIHFELHWFLWEFDKSSRPLFPREKYRHSRVQPWQRTAGFKWWVEGPSESSPQSLKCVRWVPESQPHHHLNCTDEESKVLESLKDSSLLMKGATSNVGTAI